MKNNTSKRKSELKPKAGKKKREELKKSDEVIHTLEVCCGWTFKLTTDNNDMTFQVQDADLKIHALFVDGGIDIHNKLVSI